MSYTFGSSDIAAQRPEDLASFFNPLSGLWVSSLVTASPDVAVDLGCGRGFSAAMLHHATGARRTIGLDNAPAFLAVARARQPQCSFVEHDVTQLPLPSQANVIYGRFLLAHLPNPEQLFQGWASQLLAGGLLLIEEPEGIETSIPIFRQYLELAAGMVAAQGGDLWVGRRLAQAPCSTSALVNEGATVVVPNARAAGWFLRNVESVWLNDPYMRVHCPADLRRSMSAELCALSADASPASEITWTIRRIALAPGRSTR